MVEFNGRQHAIRRFSGLFLWLASFVLRVQGDDAIAASHRPIVYTYFERIDECNRTTGMSDAEDFDLLLLWKERWGEAGYSPVVLTAETANNPQFSNQQTTNATTSESSYLGASRIEAVRRKLKNVSLDDFGTVLFRRWLAMAAVGGGWFSDYDNFPLWKASDGNGRGLEHPLPNGGKLTVYDIVSPTLASGSGIEWLDTLEALLDETSNHCPSPAGSNDVECFYTDSLAIHSLRVDHHHHPLAPKSDRKVTLPLDKNDPVALDEPSLCASRDFRTKHTVHFGPQALQRGRHVPPRDRLPGRRAKLARKWLEQWEMLCHTNRHPEASS
jgi:hypothetical protein